MCSGLSFDACCFLTSFASSRSLEILGCVCESHGRCLLHSSSVQECSASLAGQAAHAGLCRVIDVKQCRPGPRTHLFGYRRQLQGFSVMCTRLVYVQFWQSMLSFSSIISFVSNLMYVFVRHCSSLVVLKSNSKLGTAHLYIP